MDKAKKAGTPGKGVTAMSMDEMRRLWEDPGAIAWSNASIAMDCVVRSGGATAWLLRDVYCAYYRTAHNGNALSGRSGDSGEATLLMKKLYDESLFAFAGGRALPELANAVYDIVLQALGVRGRPGIAVSAVCGWLAEHLPK